MQMGNLSSDITPFSCVFIDSDYCCLLRAAWDCMLGGGRREESIEKLRGMFQTRTQQAFPCLSVRSALDLFLRAKSFSAGSEIIMSAINIPSMAELVRVHGLVPVSLDLDPRTLNFPVAALRRLLSPRTVAILVAHIFGRRMDVEPLISVANAANVIFIEDCAECFQGFNFLGHPSSDLVLFSFGIIKSRTCFGGSVVLIKNSQVCERMGRIQDEDPVQTNGEYLSKISKYCILYPFLNWPSLMGPAMRLTRVCGVDHKSLMVGFLRNFPSALLRGIRRRPSAALLSVMCRHLQSLPATDLTRSRVKGDFAVRLLPAVTPIPGSHADSRDYWLFPVIATDPSELVRKLNASGVDAYTKASQLTTIDPVASPQAFRLLHHIVYLPIHKNVPFEYIDKICMLVRKAVGAKPQSKL